MRIITKEMQEAINRNEAYRLIISTPPPDFTALQREADSFARWIAREHSKERAKIDKERDKERESFVYSHVKPKYDKDCIFMYQVI